jgi:hypothetical protein
METTLYIHAHPSRKEFAEGYAAGCNSMCDDDLQYVVVVNPLCPPDDLHIRDSRHFVTE